MISNYHILKQTWPEAPEGIRQNPLDASARSLDDKVNQAIDEIAKRYADQTRTVEHKKKMALAVLDRVDDALKTYHRDAAATAETTREVIQKEIEVKLPKNLKYNPLEVREAIAKTDPEKRYLKVEQAIKSGDVEILMHVIDTPWVRDDIAPPEQIERARMAMWEKVDARRTEEWVRVGELVPKHDRLVAEAKNFLNGFRTILDDERKVIDRLSGREMAVEAQSAARRILGIAEPTADPADVRPESPRSRADFQSEAEKVKWIGENGLQAFIALPDATA